MRRRLDRLGPRRERRDCRDRTGIGGSHGGARARGHHPTRRRGDSLAFVGECPRPCCRERRLSSDARRVVGPSEKGIGEGRSRIGLRGIPGAAHRGLVAAIHSEVLHPQGQGPPGPRKRVVVTLITSGLTAILMFGVIPDKLYDSPKSIMLSLAAGVTAPVTYFVFRQTRRRTVYRAEGPEPSAGVAIVQHPSDTHAVSAASLQHGCDLPCPVGLRALVAGRRRDRLTRVLHRLHRLLVHAHHRTRWGRDADFGRS